MSDEVKPEVKQETKLPYWALFFIIPVFLVFAPLLFRICMVIGRIVMKAIF